MFSKVLTKNNIIRRLRIIKIKIPTGRYLIYAALFFAIFMSNIITTNRKRTITAPTYTNIKIIDKNSAPSNSHKTADRKKENTRLTADNTGFDVVMTLKHVNTNKELKIKKVIISIFMTH